MLSSRYGTGQSIESGRHDLPSCQGRLCQGRGCNEGKESHLIEQPIFSTGQSAYTRDYTYVSSNTARLASSRPCFLRMEANMSIIPWSLVSSEALSHQTFCDCRWKISVHVILYCLPGKSHSCPKTVMSIPVMVIRLSERVLRSRTLQLAIQKQHVSQCQSQSQY